MALAGLFGWRDYLWAEILLPVTAAYLIARLVHAEAIPGDTQFWVTRPYNWKGLLAAKLFFIMVFINVPVFVARINILMHEGYPLRTEIWPLLCSQLLMFAGFCLPIAALASVTADTVPFILS